jgi:hypothetical protein
VINKSITKAKGANLDVKERGWLVSFVSIVTDAKLTTGYNAQGANLQTYTNEANPKDLYDIGAFAQDPGGWLQQYYRPNPQSTAGIYVQVAISSGFHGSHWPYIPTVKIFGRLDADSTQETAQVYVNATVIAITNLKAFIRSFRSIQAIKDMEIDPQLEQLVSAWETDLMEKQEK